MWISNASLSRNAKKFQFRVTGFLKKIKQLIPNANIDQLKISRQLTMNFSNNLYYNFLLRKKTEMSVQKNKTSKNGEKEISKFNSTTDKGAHIKITRQRSTLRSFKKFTFHQFCASSKHEKISCNNIQMMEIIA